MISTLLFSFLFGNSEVIIFGISIAAGLHGLTSWSDGMTKRREIGNRRWRSERYDDDYEYERQRPIEEIG